MASAETETPVKKKVPAFKSIEVNNRVICKIHNKIYRKKDKLLNMRDEEDDVFPWFICKIELGKVSKVRFQDEGNLGFPEMRDALLALPREFVHIGYLVVKTKDNAGSSRNKTIRFYFQPSDFPGAKAAKHTTTRGLLDVALDPIHLCKDVDEEDLEMLNAEILGKDLLSAGGAHPPTHLYFGPDMIHENVLNN